MRRRSTASASSVAQRAAMSLKSPGAASQPVWPCSTRSGTPPTRVATTGSPLAMASISASGMASECDVDTTTSSSA